MILETRDFNALVDVGPLDVAGRLAASHEREATS